MHHRCRVRQRTLCGWGLLSKPELCSVPDLRSGGESHTFATLRLRRLAPKQKLVIYFSGLLRIQPRVKVTNYEEAESKIPPPI